MMHDSVVHEACVGDHHSYNRVSHLADSKRQAFGKCCSHLTKFGPFLGHTKTVRII